MILTDKQNKGLKIAIDRYAKGEKYTVISGYAGTGKTTLVKFIIDALSNYNIDAKTEVCYAAYTGKAAEVLRKKVIKMQLHCINCYMISFLKETVLFSESQKKN